MRKPRQSATAPRVDESQEVTDLEQSLSALDSDSDLSVTALAEAAAASSARNREVAADLATDADSKATNARKAARPASRGSAPARPMTIYDRLVADGLLRKVTDIVLATVSIPWHLRDDAAQEVHTQWASIACKPQYEKNQVAHYAHLSGQHAALKLRRNIGAVVSIPGALFRTGRDTAFMEAIGAAVNPKDVDDYRDSIELSVEPVDVLHLSRVSEAFFKERLADLHLSPKQRNVAYKALVERKSAEVISAEMEIPLMYVERLLNQVTAKLRVKDDDAEGVSAKPPAAPKKARAPRSTSSRAATAGSRSAASAATPGLDGSALHTAIRPRNTRAGASTAPSPLARAGAPRRRAALVEDRPLTPAVITAPRKRRGA